MASLATLLTLLGVAALCWAVFDLDTAAAVLCVLLLGLLLHHLRNMARMAAWARQPLGTPVPGSIGVWDYIFACLSRRTRDAQERRELLARNLARFREANQAMPDGVIYLSQHHTIEWMNAAAAGYFGLNAETDLGRAITTLIREPDFVRYMQADDDAGQMEPLILHSQRQDGLSLAIQRIPFGENLEMVLARDITQLERLDMMRRDFVANVSHELKTPLTVVNGFVETLLDGGDEFSLDDRQRYLSLALDQSTRMQHLIEDLLTLSSLQAGSEPAEEDPVDVQALLGSVLHETRVLSGGRHQISLDAGTPASLLGSQKELHSAFSNLASNAVRYTPDGGSIHLRWGVKADGSAEFAVEDSGIGIGAEHIGRLTERFYRVDRGRSRETGGTGLGLAIVKHILTRHQAQLDIRSEPGKGSCFTARFSPKRVHPRA
ncbi:phosphate regulon sensor histidine kinase PhoR [Uliginosibacterium sp. 31-16]|nr:phosphate regulon sensor histidine kinase PhoR [Uliginosibacterium sp. 31-16]MDP5238790.1 phosphate regulon sensor histidine kinase PhoR [Uliginosibacterium sp. 31-16]